ncbi:hypothetical protein CHU92_13475 [Flavobacterium cyanobacteriorum]|uniref:Murein L,D-transpeptidase catalytic domain family protein n=1 Tax=Flavobacterium cyanobacteriorum TaxID=2022802 RepID=A0A255YV70_9FLAO|nr:murein L,D-transpeptidase catalytic domain family protein [Flavobacterium cyanobacteriorum]OYQ33146.1 hypothetical protein CHU92_13475 [Flavobacterium cyanobacteriorum]
MINSFFTSVFFLLFSFTAPTTKTESTKATAMASPTTAGAKLAEMYGSINSNELPLPSFESFSKAVQGFEMLKSQGKITKNLLTIIDFSKSSNTRRLWIINMDTKTLLYNTLVAHGRNSGEEYASRFSNLSSSNQSSLGFYATGEIYTGKHGESLKLDGLEPGINSNARSRAVVIHAADYVSESFIKQHQRLGRSQGCPALPNHLNKEIISLIKDKSCLFIYHPSRDYAKATRLIS